MGLFGAIWGFARVIWGYWLFGVDYLGPFGDLRGLSGVIIIFPTSWNFLGNHDDNNRSGDTARYAGGGTKSVIIIIPAG